MSNEAEESYPEICQLNEYLLQKAKALDPSRFVVHVSEGRHWNKSFDRLAQLFVLDDVICINSYAAIVRKDAIAVRRFWDAKLAEFSAAYPEKPVLVTEFGYPTEREQDGIKDEEEQASAIQRDLDGMGERVAGWAVWHFTDHEWEITEELEPYYGTHFSPYGVFRRDRTPKPAAALLKEYMKTHFQDK
jgi:exo-beta-1,3-glucanase (GH17 family)